MGLSCLVVQSQFLDVRLDFGEKICLSFPCRSKFTKRLLTPTQIKLIAFQLHSTTPLLDTLFTLIENHWYKRTYIFYARWMYSFLFLTFSIASIQDNTIHVICSITFVFYTRIESWHCWYVFDFMLIVMLQNCLCTSICPLQEPYETMKIYRLERYRSATRQIGYN